MAHHIVSGVKVRPVVERRVHQVDRIARVTDSPSSHSHQHGCPHVTPSLDVTMTLNSNTLSHYKVLGSTVAL